MRNLIRFYTVMVCVFTGFFRCTVSWADLISYNQLLENLDRYYVMRMDYAKVAEPFKEKLLSDNKEVFIEGMIGFIKNGIRDSHFRLYRNRNEAIETYEPRESNFNFNQIFNTLNPLHDSGTYAYAIRNRIMYLMFKTFDSKMLPEDEVIALLKEQAPNYDKVIFDVRMNWGGSDTKTQKIASLFTQTKVLAYYFVKRINEVNNEYPFYVNPGDTFIDKPGILLVGGHSTSASEGFTFFMRACGFTILGDRTGGATTGFGYEAFERFIELHNGVWIQIPDFDSLDLNKQRVEHVGIMPDISIPFDPNLPYDNVIAKAFEQFGAPLNLSDITTPPVLPDFPVPIPDPIPPLPDTPSPDIFSPSVAIPTTPDSWTAEMSELDNSDCLVITLTTSFDSTLPIAVISVDVHGFQEGSGQTALYLNDQRTTSASGFSMGGNVLYRYILKASGRIKRKDLNTMAVTAIRYRPWGEREVQEVSLPNGGIPFSVHPLNEGKSSDGGGCSTGMPAWSLLILWGLKEFRGKIKR